MAIGGGDARRYLVQREVYHKSRRARFWNVFLIKFHR